MQVLGSDIRILEFRLTPWAESSGNGPAEGDIQFLLQMGKRP